MLGVFLQSAVFGCTISLIPYPSPRTNDSLGTITGTVMFGDSLLKNWHRRSAAVEYATISVVDQGGGAMVDSSGRFTIYHVRPGKVTVRIMCVDCGVHLDSVTVLANQVSRLDVVLIGRWERSARSLLERGRWPPRLDSAMSARIRSSTRIEAYRVQQTQSGPPPTVNSDPRSFDHGSLRAVGRPRFVARSWKDAFANGLERGDFLSPAVGIKYLCECPPVVALRFHSLGTYVDLMICFECGTIGLRSPGLENQFAFFGDSGDVFARFADQVFPDEPQFHGRH